MGPGWARKSEANTGPVFPAPKKGPIERHGPTTPNVGRRNRKLEKDTSTKKAEALLKTPLDKQIIFS